MDAHLRDLIRRLEVTPSDPDLLHRVDVEHERAGLDLPMSALLRVERWQRLVGLVKKWFRAPLGEERVTITALDEVKTTLPRALRELHRLVAGRPEVLDLVDVAESSTDEKRGVRVHHSLEQRPQDRHLIQQRRRDAIDPMQSVLSGPGWSVETTDSDPVDPRVIGPRSGSAPLTTCAFELAISLLLDRAQLGRCENLSATAWRHGLGETVQMGVVVVVPGREFLQLYSQPPFPNRDLRFSRDLSVHVDVDTIVASEPGQVAGQLVVLARTDAAWAQARERLGAVTFDELRAAAAARAAPAGRRRAQRMRRKLRDQGYSL